MHEKRAVTVATARLPRIAFNTSDSVEMYLLGRMFYSHIIDADHENRLIKVHGPTEKNRLINVPINTLLDIGVGKYNDGYYRTKAKVVGAVRTPAPLIVLEVDTDRMQRVERRMFFRIEMPVEIEYRFNRETGEDRKYTARLSNISGGGLLFHDEKLLEEAIRSGDLIQVELKLTQRSDCVRVFGIVVHRRPNAGGVPGLAIRFITDNRTQDTIIRHIFEYERRHAYPTRA